MVNTCQLPLDIPAQLIYDPANGIRQFALAAPAVVRGNKMRLDAAPVGRLDLSLPDDAPDGAIPSGESTTPVSLAQIAQELLDGPVGTITAAPVNNNPAPPPARQIAPTMGQIAKISYTHDAMIDLIILTPGISQGQLAAKFGYTQSWVSNIMASDAFQNRLAERRKEVIDPTLIATFEERVKGLTLQAINKVQEAMEQPACKPEVALRALELGAKAMGLGGNAAQKIVPIDLTILADRLIALRGGPVAGQIMEGSAERIQ